MLDWDVTLFLRNLLKKLAKVNYQVLISHVWMTQVPLFTGPHQLQQLLWFNLKMYILWGLDEQELGPGLDTLMTGIQGIPFSVFIKRKTYLSYFLRA